MKANTRNVLLISLGLVMVYLFLFPRRLGTEPAVVTAWSLSADGGVTLPGLAESDKTVALVEPGGVLFVEESGLRGNWVSAPRALSLGKRGLARQLDEQGNVELVSREGLVQARFPAAGYPWFSGSNLVLVDHGASRLRVHTDQGEFRYQLEAPDLVTSWQARADGDSFVGYAGGRVDWLDGQGGVRASYRPGRGQEAVVYALLWIESRGLLAVVADLDPQTLVLLEPYQPGKGSYAFRVKESLTLASASLEPPFLAALFNDSCLVVEQPGGLGVVDLDGGFRTVLPLGGAVRSVVGLPRSRLLVCLVDEADGQKLVACKPDGRVVFSQRSFAAWNDMALDSANQVVLDSLAGVQSLKFVVK